jgi:hypothetical protein
MSSETERDEDLLVESSVINDETDNEVDGDEEDEGDIEEPDEDLEDSGESLDGENSLLDIEAIESGDESEEDSEGEGQYDWRPELHSFPQFLLLPIELRQHIWECFDWDMRCEGRVFDMLPMWGGGTSSRSIELWESATLAAQTAAARAVLATHRESREMALKFYPDTLSLRNGGLIRLNKANDVILLLAAQRHNGIETERYAPLESIWTLVAEGLPDVSTIALEQQLFHYMTVGGSPPSPEVPKDKKLLVCVDTEEYAGEELRWCITPSAQNFLHSTHEPSEEQWDTMPSEQKLVQFMYCWPRQQKQVEFEHDGIQNLEAYFVRHPDRLSGDVSHFEPEFWTFARETFLMQRFSFSDIELFDRLKEVGAMEGEWSENWAEHCTQYLSDDESLLGENEYESDGIDDDTIDSDEGNDSDDDRVLQDEADDDSLAVVANFSSVEPESPARFQDFDNPALAAEAEPHGEGDSEDESEPAPMPRRAKRRILDSDDEDVEESAPTRKRTRVVVSESEDDASGEDTDTFRDPPQDRHKALQQLGSDGDSSEEGSEVRSTEEEDEDVPRRQSLAERLQLFRAANPVSDEDEEEGVDTDMEEMDGDGVDLGDEEDDHNDAEVEDGIIYEDEEDEDDEDDEDE